MARPSRTHAVEPQPNTLRRGLDGLGDSCVVAFAVWTLFAYVGMATGARVSVLFPLALAPAALAVAALLVLRRRSSAPAAAPDADPDLAGRTTPERLRLAPFALAAAAAAAVFAVVVDVPWAIVWLLALAAVAIAVAAGRLRTSDVGSDEPEAGWAADAVAAAAALGFALLSLFVNNKNGDDVFYVNRATATAELDRIPVKDVVFTNEEVARSGGTGLPLDSYSALQGAVAHVLDVHGASVAYYLVPPVATFLAVWALWRLLRVWASRAALLCFALGCVFWIWSAERTPPGDYALASANFFLTRIWQGKVAFVAWMVPTLYVLLTRWLRRADVPGGILLVCAAVASLGLTGSAAIAVPLIVSAAALAVAARRDWARLPVLAAVVAIPVVAALAATAAFPLTVPLGGMERSTEWYYQAVFGMGVVSIVAGLAAWAAPWSARRGAPAALTTAIGAVALVVLAPGVIGVLHDALGLNGSRALRRALWVVPIPAVVGLLAAAPTPSLVRAFGERRAMRRLERVAVVVPAVLLAAVLVAFGRPLWSGEAGSRWTARPEWKAAPQPLRAARAILARYDGPGPVLADQRTMQAISILTAETKAVSARKVYARRTLEPRARIRARLRLTRFARPGASPELGERVPRALTLLDVELVCLHRRRRGAIRELMEVAPYQSAFSTRMHACVERTE